MDLTKIVLPTFILERRSLLEMYADFFAHPDIFTDIAIRSSAEERMVQVLRWYLSSFSASRKSTVAKKPYNPIIGEIFRCYYPIPALGAPSQASPSPVPWCSSTDLVFLAEQVTFRIQQESFTNKLTTYHESPSRIINDHVSRFPTIRRCQHSTLSVKPETSPSRVTSTPSRPSLGSQSR